MRKVWNWIVLLASSLLGVLGSVLFMKYRSSGRTSRLEEDLEEVKQKVSDDRVDLKEAKKAYDEKASEIPDDSVAKVSAVSDAVDLMHNVLGDYRSRINKDD